MHNDNFKSQKMNALSTDNKKYVKKGPLLSMEDFVGEAKKVTHFDDPFGVAHLVTENTGMRANIIVQDEEVDAIRFLNISKLYRAYLRIPPFSEENPPTRKYAASPTGVGYGFLLAMGVIEAEEL